MYIKNIQHLMLPIKQGIARTRVYAVVGFAKMQRKKPRIMSWKKKKFQAKRHLPVPQALHISIFLGGGWVWQEYRVFYVTKVSNLYWLTVGQGLLFLQRLRVGGECFYFFCFFTFFHFYLSPLSLSFISSAISSISLLWEMTQNDPQGFFFFR